MVKKDMRLKGVKIRALVKQYLPYLRHDDFWNIMWEMDNEYPQRSAFKQKPVVLVGLKVIRGKKPHVRYFLIPPDSLRRQIQLAKRERTFKQKASGIECVKYYGI